MSPAGMSDALGLGFPSLPKEKAAHLSDPLWLAIQSAWGRHGPLEHGRVLTIVRGHWIPDRVLKASASQFSGQCCISPPSPHSHTTI